MTKAFVKHDHDHSTILTATFWKTQTYIPWLLKLLVTAFYFNQKIRSCYQHLKKIQLTRKGLQPCRASFRSVSNTKKDISSTIFVNTIPFGWNHIFIVSSCVYSAMNCIAQNTESCETQTLCAVTSTKSETLITFLWRI